MRLSQLRPESDGQREALAKVGEADVAELRARIDGLKSSGEILLRGGAVATTSAAKTRAMMKARGYSSGVFGEFLDWLRGQNIE